MYKYIVYSHIVERFFLLEQIGRVKEAIRRYAPI